MAHNKMLIDATHPEETRVVVLRNGRVEEFDYESAARKLLRGNIYLAKVTRVEPSLQAAFIDYGGNRHGFLAFNEIHPDYYQIPMADRQALIDEEAAAEAEEEAAADARAERMARQRRHDEASDSDSEEMGESDRESDEPAHRHDEQYVTRPEATGTADDILVADDPAEPETVGSFEPAAGSDEWEASAKPQEAALPAEAAEGNAEFEERIESSVQVVAQPPAGDTEPVEQTGSEDALEELPSRPRRRPRSYKIQEVIKRRQVILVQVVKEERGNKGAALTTYLSLAGRYTVLMPNTARGGGISRKITNPQDRKRLKAIAADLEVPEGMGLIIRTAGAARTKQEIKRDFEYLLRLWESVRDLTLQSTAPSLVYEEGNLIKRSIRDLYNKEVDEIIVAGEHAHKEAKDFMRMLMPSHIKNVVAHQNHDPLFTKFGIERQLNAMFSPYVTLKSGGYLVINQAEALVAVDVNSGKATREFSIEETALNTNLEASDEIARQLKLRDLAGLIVIDFIDMEEKRNNRAVERRLKDALRFDRARIQLGRISHFGLMEMSRQRLRSGVLEGSTSQCAHCQGTGIIRSTESVALAVLRGLEDALMAGAKTSLVATTTSTVALYILNNKRAFINDMETRHAIAVAVQASDKMQGANFTIEKSHVAQAPARRPERTAVNMDWGFEGDVAEVPEAEPETFHDDLPAEDKVAIGNGRDADAERKPRDDGRDPSRRRRRRRRGRRGDYLGPERADNAEHDEINGARSDAVQPDTVQEGHPDLGFEGEPAGSNGDASDNDNAVSDEAQPDHAADVQPDERDARGDAEHDKPRRRGRRGGRRGRDRTDHASGSEGDAGEAMAGPESVEQESDIAPPEKARPAPVSRPRIEKSAGAPSAAISVPAKESVSVTSDGAPVEAAVLEAPGRGVAPASRARSRASSAAVPSEPRLERVVVKPGEVAVGEPAAAEPVRRGWWQRKLGGTD